VESKDMEIQHKEGENGGKFFMENEGTRIATIAYTRQANIITIEHTEVDPSLRGKNIGYQLVQRTAEFARENGLKVSPICPFAMKQFQKNKEWQDLMV
jgi:predicted GNAT family acetyltransferase